MMPIIAQIADQLILIIPPPSSSSDNVISALFVWIMGISGIVGFFSYGYEAFKAGANVGGILLYSIVGTITGVIIVF